MQKQITRIGLILAAALTSHAVFAATEITPFVGERFASSISIRSDVYAPASPLRFKEKPVVGVLINSDIAGQSSQYQLYYSHQSATARPQDPTDFNGLAQLHVTIDRLQIGGLYFPRGGTTGGFVEGTVGVTRMAPGASGLTSEYYPSFSLGGGAKFQLDPQLLLRLDLRGIYTGIRSSANIFCSGGCTAQTATSGYFQAEATVGLAYRL